MTNNTFLTELKYHIRNTISSFELENEKPSLPLQIFLNKTLEDKIDLHSIEEFQTKYLLFKKFIQQHNDVLDFLNKDKNLNFFLNHYDEIEKKCKNNKHKNVVEILEEFKEEVKGK